MKFDVPPLNLAFVYKLATIMVDIWIPPCADDS